MRRFFQLSLCSLLFLSACNTKTPKPDPVAKPEPTILEKIAIAHGYENWKTVKKIAFTWNIDRESSHYERSWIWKTKINEVTHISSNDTLTYNRNAMDSIAYKTNAGFTNDRYWLLAPFNLIWDKANFEYEHTKVAKAPISGETMQMLTIVYGNEGGYTPGDAYDFYFGDDYLVREWVFRKENQEEPSMTTTWENYKDINGLHLAIDHKKSEGNFNLYFDGIEIEVDGQ